MFQIKTKCTILFHKRRLPPFKFGVYNLISDGTIFELLSYFQKRYKFKIESIKLDNIVECEIKVKCNRKDKYDICNNFITELTEYIDEV